MARGQKQNDDLLMEDELAAAFLTDDSASADEEISVVATTDDSSSWEDEEPMPGQLAVDVYETKERLVVKARTAGVNKSELDVSISDGILTISGTLSSGDDTEALQWHMQECYWGEFSRTLALLKSSQNKLAKSRLCSSSEEHIKHPATAGCFMCCL